MSQIAAIATIAAPQPAATSGTAAMQPPARGQAGIETDASAPQPAAGPAASGEPASGGDALPARGDNFAAVLGRSLAKTAGVKLTPGGNPIKLATAKDAVADLGATKNTDDKTADGAAAGIAALLPLLQSLAPAAAVPKTDATTDAQAIVALGAKAGGKKEKDVGSVQALPLRDDAASEEPAASPQQRPGTGKAAQAPALLAAASAASAKGATAIPAAVQLGAETANAHSKSPEVPEGSFANALASAQGPSPVHIARPPLVIDAPVGSSTWESNVGEKLVWMVSHQEQRAELTLNPPQMGKVEVSISVNGDQANAQFVSANPAVRDALEAALPRLREMLAGAGINLGQAQVGSDSAQNASGNPANNRKNSDNSRRGSSEAGPLGALSGVASPWLRAGKGMVDVFA